ncbi:uncharacterized protein TNCV_5136391 [Trichonephila clavipes]|nr:uncharacterized protein TNCV_5136391 [Trichonephila clavipes]
MLEANPKAKKGLKPSHPEVLLILRIAKSLISTYIDKCTAMTQNTKSLGKPWETPTTVGPIPRHLERAEVIAHFHLTTEHDFLGVYLHWLGLAASADLSIGRLGRAPRGPDKLNSTRFSGYKLRSLNSKGACTSSAPRTRNELKSALLDANEA